MRTSRLQAASAVVVGLVDLVVLWDVLAEVDGDVDAEVETVVDIVVVKQAHPGTHEKIDLILEKPTKKVGSASLSNHGQQRNGNREEISKASLINAPSITSDLNKL